MEYVCAKCVYFRRHYLKLGCLYVPIHCGHCVYPRLIKREGDADACVHYSARKEKEKEKGN